MGLLKTWSLFKREQPFLIIVQNPSLLLGLFAVNYGRLFNIPIVVDAHNAGIYPGLFLYRNHWITGWLNSLSLFIIRHAALTIVTNSKMKEYVDHNGGKAEILPDPIPSLVIPDCKPSLRGKFNIVCVCSYDVDEPYMEVIKAAMQIDSEICIYITGNFEGKASILTDDSIRQVPKNVVITGYLPEMDYVNLISSCDIVLDLTTLDDSLVCGAYEAVALNKPLILSDSIVNRNYFHKGVLYVNNTAADIAEKINQGISCLGQLRREIKELRNELIRDWNERKVFFEAMFNKLEGLKSVC